MSEDIYVLGISESHNATAALVKNGELIAAISEERLSRVKTHMGFPKKAIAEVLKMGGISSKELSLVVSSFTNHAMFSLYEKDNKVTDANVGFKSSLIKSLANFNSSISRISYKAKFLHKFRSSTFPIYYQFNQAMFKGPREQYISEFLDIPVEKIVYAPHYMCHVYSSYALRTFEEIKKSLFLTLDGEGDTFCASVGVHDGKRYKSIALTPNFRSIGKLYLEVTKYLGMKPNEHEYKVMGMAPYSEKKGAEVVYDILKPLLWFDDDLVFQSLMDDRLFGEYLQDKLKGYRFDYISAGVQLFAERLIVSWVKAALKKTKTKKILLGGGVFMNVKVNKLIAEINGLQELSVCPSSGDESTAIGAAFYGYELGKNGTTNLSLPVAPIGSISLGLSYKDEDFIKLLESKKRRRTFKYKKYKNTSEKVANLVNDGQIVAIMEGRMEFGARALGNRSILADARNRELVDVLNSTIKFRDFWMPFATSVKEEVIGKYIVNPNKVFSPYMMIAYNTTELGGRGLKAGMHPSDKTTRPQMVRRSWSGFYWSVIDAYQKVSSFGGLLNTSFNLHGEPIVCSPEDALHTMEESDLKWLATKTLLIEKIKK